MHDEELGYFEPRPWHQDRPQRPKVWGDDTPPCSERMVGPFLTRTGRVSVIPPMRQAESRRCIGNAAVPLMRA
jgi:hypothetical protein